MRDVGGDILHVCQVGGYEMPSFVFWASCLIFLLFLAAAAGLSFQCSQVARKLARLARNLGKIKGRATGPMRTSDLNPIKELMSHEKLVSTSWRQFEETLLVHPANEEVYASVPLQEHLSKTSLIEENVHSGFYNSVPGILTGLGLLMTFVAILDGLSHVSVSSNMDVQGIGGLINGLSGKFVSSIVAVSCAVCFVLIERIAYAQPHRAYRKLINTLSSRFRRRTMEHLLQSVEAQLAQHMILQQEFAQSLADLRSRSKATGEHTSRGR